jgi:two-component system, chemotaxis family, sensor kinase CheA
MLDQVVSKLLLADGEPAVREKLAQMLTSAGYDVSIAEHGIDVIVHLQKEIPGILLYALDLPRVPGYDLLQVIRHRHPQVGVIALAESEPERTGPDVVLADYIYIKGETTPEMLLTKVAELIENASENTVDHQSGVGTAINLRAS